MGRSWFACVVALSASAAAAGGPIERAGLSDAGARVRADARAIAADAADGRVVVEGLALPGGPVVDLALRPFRITNGSTRFVVGSRTGADTEIGFDASRFTLLRGEVSGGGHALLIVSEAHGTVGRIEAGGVRYSVSAVDAGESVIAPAAPAGVGSCGVDGSGWSGGGAIAGGDGAPSNAIRQIEMAIETDYELFELFGDLDAAGAYVMQLYAAVADVCIRDLDATVVLTYVRLWDDPDDLWGVPDLNEFRGYWNDNMEDVHRDVAQFCSGNRFAPWGGVAYLNGLCNGSSYSVTAYNVGYFGDPSRPMDFDRDVSINAHELGHNAGTPHTHDLGIDTCDDEDTPPARGTIMAYCGQTFTGGQANNDLRFHTTVQGVVHDYLVTRDCLAFDCNLNGVDDALDIGGGGSEDANGNGVPDECEDCNGNGVLDDEDIAGGTSQDLNANGVPDECEPDCNRNGVPDDLDIGGVLTVLAVDTFEGDTGWIAENLGAISGDWERGVPVDDPDWEYDPESDSDGSGQCYLTWNALGNTDVDEGAVRLTSPVLDLTDELSFVLWDYFLRLTNQNGNDRILVEASSNDLAGPWTAVAVHDTNGGLEWRTGFVTGAQMQSLGVELTATMRVRFTVNDAEPQGVVEAGIDRFVVGLFDPPVSTDGQGDGVPDECEEDANGNGVSDYLEIVADMSLDLDRNARLDAFEDCDGDGVGDLVELAGANNIWIAGLEQDGTRQYLSITGTFVGSSAPSGVVEGHDVVITEDGRVLLSDAAGDRVVAFTLDGALIGDLVAPGAGGLDGPHGMLLVGERLLVASGLSDEVLEYDARSGSALGALVASGAGGLVSPFGLRVSPEGALAVTSDDGRVLLFDLEDGSFGGELVSAADNGGLAEPRGLLFLEDGPLLVASHGTDAVLSYDAATGAFLGKWNRNGTAEVLTLDQPWDVELGPDGLVYVSRTHDHESGGGVGGGGPGADGAQGLPLHLTNARVYAFDQALGNLQWAYVMGVDSGIAHPTGFAFLPGEALDCNMNLRPDSCDIASGVSEDANGNGVPDECEGGCAADFNGDGALNILDFVSLQVAFQAGDASADVNGDGVLNILDFVVFQGLFVAGC